MIGEFVLVGGGGASCVKVLYCICKIRDFGVWAKEKMVTAL